MAVSSRYLTFFGIILAVWAIAEAAEKYTNRYDSIDIDGILNNDRVLTNYIKCVLDKGPCTPEGRELKKTLPDALVSGCTKCNEKQKSTADKVFRHLTSKRPNDWKKLSAKYDPTGEYTKKYEASIAKSS